MKYVLVLLLGTFNAVAYAQPIYHCVDHHGHAAYQSNPCAPAALPGISSPNQVEPQTASGQFATLDKTSFTHPDDTINESDRQLHKLQRIRATSKAHAETLRVRMLLQTVDDQKTGEYAENQHRCHKAKRVAVLCGKFSDNFSCDDKGFRRESITEIVAPGTAVVDNERSYKIEQCVLQASIGQP